MKTIALTLSLSLSGVALSAQLPPPAGTNTVNAAEVRRQLREKLGAVTNASSVPAPAIATTLTPVAPADTNAVPMITSTNLPVGDAFGQAASAAQARTNRPTRVFSMPPVGTTNALAAPLGQPAPTVFPAQPLAPAAPGTPTATPLGARPPGPAGPAFGTLPGAAGTPAGTPGATAAAATNAEPVIEAGLINFPAVDISQVLQIYAELVGRTVLRATALPAQQITLKTQTALTRSEAIQALDSVLAMNGITMVNVGDKFVKAVQQGTVVTEAALFNTKDPSKLPEADQYVAQIVQLNYARPTEVLPALQPFAKIPNSILALDNSQMLIIRDYAPNVKRMLELIKAIDVIAPMDYDSEVIPIKYALASDISSALGSLGGGTGTSVGRGSGSGGGLGGGGLGGGLGGRGGIGGGGLGGGVNGVGGFGNNGGINGQAGIGGLGGGVGGGGGAGARGNTFSDRLSSLVNRAASAGEFRVLGQTKIIADERTNSLLVFAGKEDMKMIKSIIEKLDVVLAQVLIEAIIMEVDLSDNKSLGVSYLQTKPTDLAKGGSYAGQGGINNVGYLTPSAFGAGTNGAAGLASGFSYLANLGGSFDATVTAAASDSHVNVLSRPRIQTSHAVTASLQVGETIPYVTGTYYNGLSGGPSSQYQQLFVGINLQVTPLINPEGLVVMDIVQDIQDLDGSTAISGVGNVPNTSKRTASAKVSVRDRDTIILGGFITAHKNLSKSGVPFLKDIPLLGYLFNSSSSSSDRKELMVLIRPTVLPSPESAALQARTEVNRSSALKGAERDYRKEDLRMQKDADKIKIPKED